MHDSPISKFYSGAITGLIFACVSFGNYPVHAFVESHAASLQDETGTGASQEVRDYATVKKEWDQINNLIGKYNVMRRRTPSARKEKEYADAQKQLVDRQREMVHEFGQASLKEFKTLQAKLAAKEAQSNANKADSSTSGNDDQTTNDKTEKQSEGDNENSSTGKDASTDDKADEMDPDEKMLAELSGNILGLINYFIEMDQPWRASEYVKEVVKYDNVNPRLYDSGAYAAFSSNEFALSKQALQKAEEFGGLLRSEGLIEVIDEEIEKWNREQELRTAEEQNNDLPRVKFETTAGDIVLELYENEAPETVGNFVSLVESGFYDGTPFHRVLKNFMAQSGSPDGSGAGGPGYTIYCECEKEGARMHFAGSLSMAKTPEKNTGGSQFFITFRPTPHLDGKHTVFGRVIEGMDSVAEIEKVSPGQSLIEETKIIKASVLRKRDHEYKPNKVGGEADDK